jgi:Cu(I)/Ag(I) efflux system membrane protein CusA/SilA
MLQKIIEWSINNRLLVILAVVFLIGWGLYSMVNISIDAIPDLSDVQVIIYTEYPGQSPRIVEDQVTYPLTTSMVSVPGSKVVRGYSFFGYSLIYIIFEDGTDLYWARSRVLEYLNYAQKRLPQNVVPPSDGWNRCWLGISIRSLFRSALAAGVRCWYLKPELTAVEGVAGWQASVAL